MSLVTFWGKEGETVRPNLNILESEDFRAISRFHICVLKNFMFFIFYIFQYFLQIFIHLAIICIIYIVYEDSVIHYLPQSLPVSYYIHPVNIFLSSLSFLGPLNYNLAYHGQIQFNRKQHLRDIPEENTASAIVSLLIHTLN